MSDLTHLDKHGNAHMVDVSAKPVSERTATARGEVRLSPATVALLRSGDVPKGDALAVARIAGIMAAKNTSSLVPLCHPLMLSSVKVDLEVVDSGVEISAVVKIAGKTGVEMEALTAVSVAALTIYDMVKAVDRDGVISNIRLVHKSGGVRGEYTRSES